MKLLLLLIAVLWASPLWAVPFVEEDGGPGYKTYRVTFKSGDTTESEPIAVDGLCDVRVSHSGSGTVELWAIPTRSTTSTSGTQVGTDFTSSTTTATALDPGTLWVKAIATSASADTLMVIHCSQTQVSSSGSSESLGSNSGAPSFASIGGTGRPAQAFYVDTSLIAWGTRGPGRDDDGSTYAGCIPNDVSDQPCTYVNSASGLVVYVDSDATATANEIDIDMTSPGAEFFCRNSTNFLHGTGTGHEAVGQTSGDVYPIVYRSVATDTYRLIKARGSSVLDCTDDTGTEELAIEQTIGFAQVAGDELMLAVPDQIHGSPFLMRYFAQELAEVKYEDQVPAWLGVSNLWPDGDDCDLWTASGGALSDNTAFDPNHMSAVNTQAFIGPACQWDLSGTSQTLTSAAATVYPGRFYVGAVSMLNNVILATKTLDVRLLDQTDTEVSSANIKWWVQSNGLGTTIELADLDPLISSSGDFPIFERFCWHGCRFKFAVQIPNGVTGLKLRVENGGGASQDYGVDEAWLRPKLYADLERHNIIQDGLAKVKIFTDSRGSTEASERFPEALDHLLGYATSPGGTRSLGTIRPNLTLTDQPTSVAEWQSGRSLGNFVGDWDANEGYSGSSASGDLGSSMDTATTYNVTLFSVNDWVTGGAWPSSAAAESDSTDDRHEYWIDQWRAFEFESEQRGSMTIHVLDMPHRVDNGGGSLDDCQDVGGTNMNCGQWYVDMLDRLYHDPI